MNVKPKSLREPHYADTHERDNKQRSLIGRAVPGDCVGKYRVFLQYDLRDPSNFLLNRNDPNLVNHPWCNDLFMSEMTENEMQKLQSAGVFMPERHGGREFSVVADLKPTSDRFGVTDLKIDFGGPIRQSDYVCDGDTIHKQISEFLPAVKKYGSMAMEYTDQFKAERDAARPKRPVTKRTEVPLSGPERAMENLRKSLAPVMGHELPTFDEMPAGEDELSALPIEEQLPERLKRLREQVVNLVQQRYGDAPSYESASKFNKPRGLREIDELCQSFEDDDLEKDD